MTQPIVHIKKIPTFFIQVKAELLKVSWPSRKDLLGTAAVVIVATAMLTTYIGILDLGLTQLVSYVMK